MTSAIIYICSYHLSIYIQNIFPSTVEQVKSSSEIRDKIVAAAREARKLPSYPAELISDLAYPKDQGLIMEDFRHLTSLVKPEQLLAHGVSVTVEKIKSDEEKHLWMDTQSHSSSASSDSQEIECCLGYPTSFYTQFKVSEKSVLLFRLLGSLKNNFFPFYNC